MIVLGIDTSGYYNAVGVVDSDQVLAEFNYEARTDTLEKIFINIDDVLKKAGIALADIEGIGVGLGPGSWTGIRVGVTVGKMLAYGMKKLIAGIPTLEALAYNLRGETRPVCAVIGVGAGDAVYAAIYSTGNNDIIRAGDYYVGDIRGLATLIKEPSVIVATNAADYTRNVTRETKVAIEALEATPGGAAIASLAVRRLERGDSDDVLALTPLYLKESTAKAFINKYGSSHK